MAVRSGPWKAHFFTQTSYVKGSNVRHEHDPPLLYHLDHDPSERFNLNEKHPEVLEAIQEVVDKHRADLVIAESQLEIPLQGK